MISAIVAKTINNVIGKDNDLLWNLPNDLKRFKEKTMGKTVIMGRNTFDSIGALKGRKSIVLTQENIPGKGENLTFINNINNIDEYIYSDEDFFVIGGSQIYSIFLPYAQKLYVTEINEIIEGDAFFPIIEPNEWKLVEEENGIMDAENPFDYKYLTYIKTFNQKYCSKNSYRADTLFLECWQACNLICPYKG